LGLCIIFWDTTTKRDRIFLSLQILCLYNL
jgi:hypothetical protein